MAAPKSSSRKAAAKKKAAKTATSKIIAKKAVKPAKRPAAGKKKAAKKASAPRRKRPTVVQAAVSPAVADLDQRIAIVRNNLRDLTEMAAASSGASNEELASSRITEQEAQLLALTRQRDDLVRRKR
jgi:hypothetical protein